MASGDITFIPPTGDVGAIGAPIVVGTSVTMLHTTDATVGTGVPFKYEDFVTVEAWNLDSLAQVVDFFVGGTSAANKITVEIPPGFQPIMIIDRWPLRGGVTVEAQAAVPALINVKVQVDRYEN